MIPNMLRSNAMEADLKRLQDTIEHAVRNLKLDPEAFKQEILDDLDVATRCFAACIESIKARLKAQDYRGALTDLQGISPRGV
jgi:hypothetical protein